MWNAPETQTLFVVILLHNISLKAEEHVGDDGPNHDFDSIIPALTSNQGTTKHSSGICKNKVA